ncbi:MAG: type I-U CRISPR-associated protein Csx17 [Acidimicrobiia bacterium]|nr:type I-U CRISPR-associated protein Csx17 [Acidimicrobiia bacterium]
MNTIHLSGCTDLPLMRLLSGFGVIQAVGTQLDPSARFAWRRGELVVHTMATADELVDFFLDSWSPTPIISPWNGSSGFDGRAAQDDLEVIEGTSAPRFADYRDAISVGRSTFAELARNPKFVDPSNSKITADGKARMLLLLRERLPDAALPWLDAAVVSLGHDTNNAPSFAYPAILGSGGNDGRLEFSRNFATKLVTVLSLTDGRGSMSRQRSEELLRQALFSGSTRLVGDATGMFDPAGAGDPRSAWKEKQFVSNPWTYVLCFIGTTMMRSSAARQWGAESGAHHGARHRSKLSATPFMFEMSPIGHASAASENARAEFWAPLWNDFWTLREIRHLLGQGRVSWRGKQAKNALDAVRGASSLGAARGVSVFNRFVFAERNGLSVFAVPAGQVRPRSSDVVPLTSELDRWLDRLEGKQVSNGVIAELHATKRALWNLAMAESPERLQDVLIALGGLEAQISRSPSAQEFVPPVPHLNAREWAQHLDDGSPEHRIALALATQRDWTTRRTLSLRTLIRPIRIDGRQPTWYGTRSTVSGLGSRPILQVLADALASRFIEVQREPLRNPSPRSSAEGTERSVATTGVGLAVCYPTRPVRVSLGDVAQFLNVAGSAFDLERFERLLIGYLPFSVGQREASSLAAESSLGSLSRRGPRDPFPYKDLLPMAYLLLAPFFVPLTEWNERTPEGSRVSRRLMARPRADWGALLAAGRTEEVVQRAITRLRIGGLQTKALSPLDARGAGSVIDPTLLAASLLIPIGSWSAADALARVVGDPAMETNPRGARQPDDELGESSELSGSSTISTP